jgi:hypothetical protein
MVDLSEEGQTRTVARETAVEDANSRSLRPPRLPSPDPRGREIGRCRDRAPQIRASPRIRPMLLRRLDKWIWRLLRIAMRPWQLSHTLLWRPVQLRRRSVQLRRPATQLHRALNQLHWQFRHRTGDTALRQTPLPAPQFGGSRMSQFESRQRLDPAHGPFPWPKGSPTHISGECLSAKIGETCRGRGQRGADGSFPGSPAR